MRTTVATITTAALLVMGGGAYINATAEDTASTSTATTPWTMDKVSPPEPVVVPETEAQDPEPEPEVTPAPSTAEVEVGVVIEPLPSPVVPEVQACGAGLTLAEDGSCVPLSYWDYVEPTTEVGSSWDGLLVGDVIVCPEGFEVSIDVTPAGTVWAACM